MVRIYFRRAAIDDPDIPKVQITSRKCHWFCKSCRRLILSEEKLNSEQFQRLASCKCRMRPKAGGFGALLNINGGTDGN